MESLTGYKLQIILGIQEKYEWDDSKKISSHPYSSCRIVPKTAA